MKTAKAAALLAVILLLSISFGACSANNAAAETEASQQTPEATSTPDVTVELDTSEDKGAGKSNAGSMSVDEQRYASVLDLYYQALYAHQAGTADWDRDKYVVERGLAECIVNPYWAWENSDGLLSRIGYSFRDLNGDGTNELLLGWKTGMHLLFILFIQLKMGSRSSPFRDRNVTDSSSETMAMCIGAALVALRIRNMKNIDFIPSGSTV